MARAARSRPAAVLLILATAAALSRGAPASADGTGAPPPPPSGPTLAIEDTLHPIVSEPYPEILVTARRQSLDEILRHVAEGEAHRDSLIHDQAFTLFLRMVGRDSKETPVDTSEPYVESVLRIYQKKPGKVRVVRLREWSRYDDQKTKDRGDHKSNVRVDVNGDMSEQFIGFAFDPSKRSRYRFQIEDRKLVGDHVVYVLGFAPRSPLDLLPTGRAWVDTNDFVILREEFGFDDRSPAPLFLESLDTCVLERTLIDRRYWVISRVFARATLTDPTRWMARIARAKLPKVADFAITRSDWIVNGDIPDSLFAVPAAERK